LGHTNGYRHAATYTLSVVLQQTASTVCIAQLPCIAGVLYGAATLYLPIACASAT